MITTAQVLLLLGAGVLAGVIGAAGGITSLISYPALLVIGIPPLPANVTNAVALVASLPGSALGSRPELRGRAPWLRRWAALTVAGALAGVVLLLVTPDRVFDRIVPYLLTLAALILLFQPLISRWHTNRSDASMRFAWPIGLFVVSVYSGYFGAGSGIMIIAVLLVTIEHDFAMSNALKNIILGISDLVAAVAFLLFGPVHVEAALLVGAGLLVGSFFGPKLTRRVPSDVLRVVAATLGLGLAIWLWIDPRG